MSYTNIEHIVSIYAYSLQSQEKSLAKQIGTEVPIWVIELQGDQPRLASRG